ncbi:NAD(P)/FAD-dependent oxidoreductase [Paracraurococcus lichenis]|uniref:NADH:ubiquinone reductase (non-electrogenic) n=1 Tax=Paracraurococcus lichenis TaxID=3064888 RepID=A0ABT9E3G2_9PROT|nr:NAD(P)/FAD-dependent oxidoreductase [Paracraurococcus sp. LOR1-02]MDO9710692.1 NAD(P)/FAD-dependent oxidoreductase [Paracraurococcus sp. LOR1-02]
MTEAAPPLRIVILGAGFGGLEAARALAHAPVEVTLVDRHNHHLFQPLLYQVATAALSPGDIAWPVRSIFRRQRNLRVVMAEVTGLDLAARCVRAGELDLPYDALVVATGATHSYFGRDDWAPVAPGLKAIEDATDIRRRLLLAFERAEITADAEERRRLLTFVVVGGGPTGVELAGAMVELARHAMPREFRRIDPAQARVVLIEAGPRILPTFPEELGEVARRSLERMGVQVLTGTRVTDCTPTGVQCGEERIAASTIVWAAGVVASPVGGWLGTERDRAGRVRVGPDLAVPGHAEVFAVGDLAAVTDAKGRPVPGNAPAAKQMGRYVGRLLAARAVGQAPPPPFAYRHHGDLATIGRRSAVVSLDGMRLTGLIGWLFWGVAHVWYLIGFRSRVVVSFEWLWSYLTFQRGARLITGREPAGGNATPMPGERQAAALGTRVAERLPAAAPRELPAPRRVAAGG